MASEGASLEAPSPTAEEARPEQAEVPLKAELESLSGQSLIKAAQKSEDVHVVQLIIVVSNLTSDEAERNRKTERERPRSAVTADRAAQRLLSCISAIVREKRAQFMHFRLQWLVFEYTRKSSLRFELTDLMSTPRSQHAQKAREAWWFNISHNLDVNRREVGTPGAGFAMHNVAVERGVAGMPGVQKGFAMQQGWSPAASKPSTPVSPSHSQLSTSRPVSRDFSRKRPAALQDTLGSPTRSDMLSPKSVGFSTSGSMTRGLRQGIPSSPGMMSPGSRPGCSSPKPTTRQSRNPKRMLKEMRASDISLSNLDKKSVIQDAAMRMMMKRGLQGLIPSILGDEVDANDMEEAFELDELLSLEGSSLHGSSQAASRPASASYLSRLPSGAVQLPDHQVFSTLSKGMKRTDLIDVIDRNAESDDEAQKAPSPSNLNPDDEDGPIVEQPEPSALFEKTRTVLAHRFVCSDSDKGKRNSTADKGEWADAASRRLGASREMKKSKSESWFSGLHRKSTATAARRASELFSEELRLPPMRSKGSRKLSLKALSEGLGIHHRNLPRWDPEATLSKPASMPVARMFRGVEPRSPGGMFQEEEDEREPAPSMTTKADSQESGILEHRISLRMNSAQARQGINTQRRQRRIDRRIDHMVEHDQVSTVRNYIRSVYDGERTLKAELEPLPLEGPLPTLSRRHPVYKSGPPGARSEEASSVTLAYATACHKKNMVQVPKCLVDIPFDEQSPGRFNRKTTLDLRDLNLTDKEAVPIVAGLRAQNSSFEVMLLSGNPQLTDAFHQPLLKMACERSMRPSVLDLSGCSSMGETSMRSLADALPIALMKLKILRLDGTRCESEASWLLLSENMRSLIYLQELSLADMYIGRGSQKIPCLVADLCTSLPALTSLNMSNNFLSFEGCKALQNLLAVHESIRELDCSHNANGFVLPHSSSGGASAGTGSALQYDNFTHGVATFNPLSLVCEAVRRARALKILRLSGSQLNFDEDMILEDAIASKQGAAMEELDLSSNPFQGRMGVRCLLRTAVRTPSLHIQLCDVKEALRPCAAHPYEYSDPTAHYSLSLEHPQHRALLRSLLRRCTVESKKDIADCFTFEGRGDEVAQLWNQSKTVPAEGELNFSFSLPVQLDDDCDVEELIDRISKTRKLKVGLVEFTKIAKLYAELADRESRLIFLDAMSMDLLIKHSHVRYIGEVDSVLKQEVIDRLLPAVSNLDKLGGFDLALNSDRNMLSGRDASRSSVINLLLFNPHCPDGHYVLDVGIPSDRKTLEHLILINAWERNRAIKKGRPDLSLHGGHESIRNCTVSGGSRVWRSADSQIPSRAEFTLDYQSAFFGSCHKGLPVASDLVVKQLQTAIINTDARPKLKLFILRTVLHRLVLSAEHIRLFCEAFPRGPNADDPSVEIRDSSRVEAFQIMYCRCNNIRDLLANEKHGLYSLAYITREEVLTVRKRLGRSRCWDLSRLDQECLIPTPDTPEDEAEFDASGRLGLIGNREQPPMGFIKKDHKERMAEADLDQERMRSIIEDYSMHDNPVSIGNANWYAMDLSVHEDWRCASLLLAVCHGETGENIDEPFWSETAHLAARGSKWLVPEDWYKEVPDVGLFCMRFKQGFNVPNMDIRLELAEARLGW
eukprot:TRINITY_DN87508_c0_g1_i1.p1 TRINITY_DN87508_c0_g1~~TRINITY_DN87508_c0_g1_i1.p1  ORF type:complete len:1632 (-),score=307.88 TRINITY_DN87508_c0_g1_i1:73-4968(-)